MQLANRITWVRRAVDERTDRLSRRRQRAHDATHVLIAVLGHGDGRAMARRYLDSVADARQAVAHSGHMLAEFDAVRDDERILLSDVSGPCGVDQDEADPLAFEPQRRLVDTVLTAAPPTSWAWTQRAA